MDYSMIFCVNKSLGMSKGKIASQTAHAAHIATDYILKNKINIEIYNQWYSNGAKMIVLGLTEDEMYQIKKMRNDIIWVYDAGLTQIEPHSLTTICIFPTKEKLKYKLL